MSAAADEPVSLPTLVAGIGFRRGAGAEEIVALVHRALEAAGCRPDALDGLATAIDRAGDPAFLAAAVALAAAPIGLDPAALRGADAHVVTRSARVEALRGIGSLAEAAALAAIGPGARLTVPRVAAAGATCALAERDDPGDPPGGGA